MTEYLLRFFAGQLSSAARIVDDHAAAMRADRTSATGTLGDLGDSWQGPLATTFLTSTTEFVDSTSSNPGQMDTISAALSALSHGADRIANDLNTIDHQLDNPPGGLTDEELDDRESTLNGRISDLESEWRNAVNQFDDAVGGAIAGLRQTVNAPLDLPDPRRDPDYAAAIITEFGGMDGAWELATDLTGSVDPDGELADLLVSIVGAATMAGLADGPDGPELVEATESLINGDGFGDLDPLEALSVLAQVRNYPDTRSIENMERLTGKDWFQDFDLEDTQRGSKLVAFLSQHDDGDRTVIDNTLDLFLADDAPYHFNFDQTGGAYGSAPGPAFKLNRIYLDAGNDPVDVSDSDTLHMVTHTMAHEINHLVNDDQVDQSFEYFEEEYRAYYVGFVAENGHTPEVEDVLGRVRHLLTANSGAYSNIRDALNAGDDESDQIVEFMSDMLGRDDLTHDNVVDMIDELTTDGGDQLDASANVPSGNLDNS